MFGQHQVQATQFINTPFQHLYDRGTILDWDRPQLRNRKFYLDERHLSEERFIDLTCQPKNADKRALLWSCSAKVTFLRTACDGVVDQAIFEHLFSNNDPTYHFTTHLKGNKGNYYYSRGLIDIIQSSCMDLADPDNPLIEGPEDAVCFKVDGVGMYLSKKMLDAQSPVFHTMFADGLKENAKDFYVLKEVDLEGFLRFLGIIHSINLSVDKKFVENLLYLGDRFQCKLVLQLGEECLLKLPEEDMSLAKKLALANLYKLNCMLLEATHGVSKIPQIQELKQLLDSENKLIGGSDDVAHFKVGGVDMYLSKKILGCHSPLFKALFTRCFNEKAEDFYELKDINSNDFLRFVGLIHSIDLSVDDDSLENLLQLGYTFKCRLVLRLCEDYLLTMTVEEMDWQKKIVIGDRYKLNSVLLQAMEGVSRKKWRIFREKQQLSEYTLALYLRQRL
ncbi:hypothetical protein L596_013016 [Steinernema carpocapsae]|uniref:BTB domain-containing protein n=1 Tax=Steinernema carpocapsae TaxID=34508 RepID=A0A4U5NZT2_STECR|nr:hypothetical protein L596_013016 [Steinernema carpocapsae]